VPHHHHQQQQLINSSSLFNDFEIRLLIVINVPVIHSTYHTTPCNVCVDIYICIPPIYHLCSNCIAALACTLHCCCCCCCHWQCCCVIDDLMTWFAAVGVSGCDTMHTIARHYHSVLGASVGVLWGLHTPQHGTVMFWSIHCCPLRPVPLDGRSAVSWQLDGRFSGTGLLESSGVALIIKL
jgi:hypothetical protein